MSGKVKWSYELFFIFLKSVGNRVTNVVPSGEVKARMKWNRLLWSMQKQTELAVNDTTPCILKPRVLPFPARTLTHGVSEIYTNTSITYCLPCFCFFLGLNNSHCYSSTSEIWTQQRQSHASNKYEEGTYVSWFHARGDLVCK